MNFTRRELLERCAAFGALTLVTQLPLSALAAEWDEAEKKRQPTPFCELGPFCKREAPNTSTLRKPGDPGMPLTVSGIVYDTRGRGSAQRQARDLADRQRRTLRHRRLSLPCSAEPWPEGQLFHRQCHARTLSHA